MIIFMPERVYEYFKNDDFLNEKIKEISNKVYNESQHYDLKNFLSIDEHIFDEVNQYMLNNVSDELRDELNICLNGYNQKANLFAKNIEKYDVETQIYLMYMLNDGDMSPSEDLFNRYKRINELYEQNDLNFSAFIHTIYYFTNLYLQWVDSDNLKKINENGFFSYQEVKKMLSYEDTLFSKMKNKVNSEQYFNILFHKRIQMMYLFMLFIGQFSENFDDVVELIIRKIYDNRFKYDNFNYLKLAINHIFFQTYFDKGDFTKAKKYLMYNISMINYGFAHKFEMVKALNHFNKIFSKEFCNYLFFLYTMIRVYIPSLQKEFNILNSENATEFEKRLLFGKLQDDEKMFGLDLNPNEWLSFKWCQLNKSSFDYFNKNVDILS